MTRFDDFPGRLAHELSTRRAVLARRLADAGVTSRPVMQGYLVAIEASATALLANHRILALPASVFGSLRQDLSIVSALTTAVHVTR